MAQINRLDITFSETDMADINAALATLNEKLAPHLISLSSEDRMVLPKLGDKTRAFVDKAREYAQQYPELVPKFVDMTDFDTDLAATDSLSGILRRIQPLTRNLEDSHLLSGSEAYQAALIYYRSVKMAAESGIPNASAIYTDLAQRFERTSSSRTAASSEETAVA